MTNKTTGKKAATAASKVLSDGRTSKTSKTAAAGAIEPAPAEAEVAQQRRPPNLSAVAENIG